MYFHVFTSENVYSFALLSLFEKNIDLRNHFFFFGFGKKQKTTIHYSTELSQQIKYLQKPADIVFFLKNIKAAKWIYLHYLAYDPTLLFWATNLLLLKKTTWVVWGNDIYSYYKRNKNLKTRIYERLRVKVIANIPEIAAFVREDFDLIKSIYKTNANYSDILYPLPVNIEHLNFEKTISKSHDLKFLIGNSGDPSNLHHEMITYLSRFKDEKITVFCPLSYGGSKEYREAIVQHGKDAFGDNFVAITSHLEKEAYAQFLNSIDIALMNHKRQQGLGNILPLLYLDKKVFLRTDITSYYFFQRQKCEVFNIETLNVISFKELVSLTEIESNNKQIVTEIMSEKNYLNLWMNLINRHKND